MSTFTENQEQKLYKIIYTNSPDMEIKEQDKIFTKIERLANQYYSILSKLGNKTFHESDRYLERTGEPMEPYQMIKHLMKLVDANRPKIAELQGKIHELAKTYFGLDELIDEERPLHKEYMEVGV